MIKKYKFFIFVCSFLVSFGYLWAQDKITPTKSTATKPVTKPQPLKTKEPLKPDLKPSPSTTDKLNASEKETEKAKDSKNQKPKEAPPEQPSKVSKLLSDKLLLEAAIGYVYVSNSKGDWNSFGAAQISVLWNFLNVMGIDAFATYRYIPIELTANINNRSYRGIIQGHYFGSRGVYKLNDSWNIVGGAELGYMVVDLTAFDGLGNSSGVDDNGFSFSINGGADWKAFSKFYLGPRLFIGFGSFTTIELAGAATFIF